MSLSASDLPARRTGRRWLWWTLGGCGTLVVLAIAAIVVLIIVIAHNVNPNGNCLPSGFPVEPSLSKVTTVNLAGTCTTVYRSSDSPSSVEAFYSSALDQNGWQVTANRGSSIRFRRSDNTSEAGPVSVTTSRGRTQVAVVLRS
jgi:hypothetical protein